MFRKKSNAKLGNKRIFVDGITFDSMAEARRYRDLKLLEKNGDISGLELQKRYELIPAQYELKPTGETYKRGNLKGQQKLKKVCIEQSLVYIADFVYKDNRTGEIIVEDVKGYTDPKSAVYAKFVIKRKLMLWLYGIRVVEVKC